jgi:hypothetical protein
MRPLPTSNDCPDVPRDLRAPDDLIKRICKLRWIGMEDEARALEQASQPIASVSPVLTSPMDTD